jgi:hypothetical protein
MMYKFMAFLNVVMVIIILESLGHFFDVNDFKWWIVLHYFQCTIETNFQVIKDKLIWILSTTFFFIVIFCGIFCVVIFQKYQKYMLVLYEMQTSMLKFTLIVVLYVLKIMYAYLFLHQGFDSFNP